MCIRDRLQSADKEALKKRLYTFLQSKASLLTPENMQEIRQDFAQMVYSFLKQKEIQYMFIRDRHKSEISVVGITGFVHSIRECDMSVLCELVVFSLDTPVQKVCRFRISIDIIQHLERFFRLLGEMCIRDSTIGAKVT